MKNATNNTARKPAAGTLNVVLHGMFGFVNSNKGIEVLVPQVDEHVFKAGNWGEELRLKEGRTYKLAGVQAASKHPGFNPEQNVIVLRKLKVDSDPKKLFCSIKFPLPSAIYSLRRRPTNTPNAVEKCNEKLAGQPKEFSHVRVLSYKFKNVKDLSLGKQLSWTPCFQNGYCNLHIFSETEMHASEMHERAAWKKILSLFPGLKLDLARTAGQEPPVKTKELSEAPGLLGDELLMLAERLDPSRLIKCPAIVAEGTGSDPCESLIVGG